MILSLKTFCNSIRGKLENETLKTCCVAFSKSFQHSHRINEDAIDIVDELITFCHSCEDVLEKYVCFLCMSECCSDENEKVIGLLFSEFLDESFDQESNSKVPWSLFADVIAEMAEYHWSCLHEKIRQVLIPAEHEEAEDDKSVARFEKNLILLDKCMLVIRYTLMRSPEEEKLWNEIPFLLLSVIGKEETAFRRKELVCPVVHLFFANGRTLHMDLLWKTVKYSKLLGLQLLCRTIKLFDKKQFLMLVAMEGYWAYLFEQCEHTVENKNLSASVSKQALFALKESVEVIVNVKNVVEDTFITKIDKQAAMDWNRLISMLVLLLFFMFVVVFLIFFR